MKKQKSISLEADVYDDIELNPEIENFSEWITKHYKNEFMSLTEINRQLLVLERKKRYLTDKKLVIVSKSKKVLDEVNPAKTTSLREMIKSMAKGFDKNIQLKRYNSEFCEDIKMKEFDLLIERVKNEDQTIQQRKDINNG